MNRRSMLKAATGACAVLLFPWRKAEGREVNEDPRAAAMREMRWRTKVTTPGFRMDQIRRIKRLLEAHETEQWRGNRKLYRNLAVACEKYGGELIFVTYNTTVKGDSCTSDVIEIWLDERHADKEGLCGCGLILLTASLAASMDDKKLLRHLEASLLVSMTPPYVSRQGMFRQFKGKPVVIDKLGGLSKT